MQQTRSQPRWADESFGEDDSTNAAAAQLSAASPSPSSRVSTSTSLPDGSRTMIEHYTNDKGQKVKVTKQVKMVTKKVMVKKSVLERRQWAKFGACKDAAPGPEANVTYASYEVIHLDLRPKKREEEKEDSSLDKLAGGSIVVCRNCGETGHWTLKCPKRREIKPFGDSLPPSDAANSGSSSASASASSSSASASASASSSSSSSTSASSSSSTSGGSKYVPVHLRNAAAGGGAGGAAADDKRMYGRDGREEYSLRVNNVNTDVTDDDLYALFRAIGHTTRVFLAKDKKTGESRGFAYVSYATRADADTAIAKLHRKPWHNLILSVEYAPQRSSAE